MVIYKIINPEYQIYTIVSINKYLAIQTAKKLDNFKYTESQYKILNKK
jgi:hypothetical protein